MSKELENEVPLSSKEAGMKLHYLYYQQFHSLHRMYRTNATRAERYFTYNVTYIYPDIYTVPDMMDLLFKKLNGE